MELDIAAPIANNDEEPYLIDLEAERNKKKKKKAERYRKKNSLA